jgi:hypothetical protein
MDTFVKVVLPILALFTGGLGGAILTHYLKTRSEKNQRKIVSITTTEVNLSLLASPVGAAFSSKPLLFSLGGQQYENLVLYNLVLKNAGLGGVEGLKLVLSFDQDTKLVKFSYSSTPVILKKDDNDEILNLETSTQITYKIIDSVAKDDTLNFFFLFDTNKPNSIKFNVRGKDDTDFLSNIVQKPKDQLVVPPYTFYFLTIILFIIVLSLLQNILATYYR